MKYWDNFWSWVGKKAYNYKLPSNRKKVRDESHPEQYKSRDGLEANKDAQVFRANNDIVSSYSKAVQSGVVGTGFTLQYKSDDEDLNKDVESWLKYWSEYKNCDITQRFFRQVSQRWTGNCYFARQG